MTYNVLLGGEGRLEDLAAVIERVNPDVVALLEARAAGTGRLAAELGMESVIAESNHAFPRGLGICVAWLSRLPIVRAEDHRLPELSKTLLEIEVGGLRLFAAHLASGHEVAEHPRERELRAIVSLLDGADRTLLVGDLNALARGDPVGDPPPGVEPRGDALPRARRDVLLPLVAAGYVDCYRRLHPLDSGYTFPAGAPWLRLDYVFASPDLAPLVRDSDVVRSDLARRASDHLPVWADLGVPAGDNAGAARGESPGG